MPKPARGLDPDPTERFGFPVPNTTGPVVPPAAGSVAPLPSEPGPPETSGVEPAPARPEVPVDQAEAIGPFRAGVEEPAQATQPVEAGTSEVGQPAVVPGMQPAAPVLDAVSAVPALSESPHVGLRRVATSLLAVPEAQKKRRKHRYLPWLLAVLAVELVVGGVVIVKSPFTVVHHDTVPPVVGLDNIAARAAIARTGLYPELVAELYSQRAAAGAVISQSPLAGTREKAGSIVKVVISLGPHPTTLPSLTGLSEAASRSALAKANLVAHYSLQYSETIPTGVVVKWRSLAGARVFYGDAVDVVVSKGPMPRTIPVDLGGGVLTWTQAQTTLFDLHLVAAENPRYSTTIPAGYVVTTEPAPGTTVPGHSRVLVFVSQGPPYVTVPQIYGSSAATAEQTLTGLGLKWVPFGPTGANTVLTTLPRPGQSVRWGTTVDIYLY